MRFFIQLLAFLLCILSSNHLIARAYSNDVLVDELTSDYLKVEQNLWNVIEKREPSTLQQIYNIHTYYMGLRFGEINVLSESIYLTLNQNISENVDVINNISANLTVEFFQNRNYVALSAVAEKGIQLEREIEAIFQATINDTLFWELVQNLTRKCHGTTDTLESEYQVLFEYYKDIQAISLKAYISSQLSYMILHLHESGNFHNDSVAYRRRFIDRTDVIKISFQEHLAKANRNILKCVSADDQKLDTNIEINKFLQGYIDNEIVLNPEGSCSLTCADYKKTYLANCQQGSICGSNRARKCNGVLRDCHGMADNLDICPSSSNETCRYNYVRLDGKKLLGQNNGQCQKEINIKSWIRWFVKCSNCFCLCDDTTESDRYFSLRDVVSNIRKNKIVTGIQIVKRNRLIQFEIVERELYSVLRNENRSVSYRVSALNFTIDNMEVQEGSDYHTLTYENRGVTLDTVTAPPGHVVTGVRFAIIDNRLSVQIRATEVNLKDGTLQSLSESIWVSNSPKEVKQFKLNGHKLSTKAPNSAEPTDIEDAYLEFGPTDINDDLSQYTIPFIDGFAVEPKIPTLLAGIGLYHKGQPGYGGFLAPKLVVYKFEPIIVNHSEEGN